MGSEQSSICGLKKCLTFVAGKGIFVCNQENHIMAFSLFISNTSIFAVRNGWIFPMVPATSIKIISKTKLNNSQSETLKSIHIHMANIVTRVFSPQGGKEDPGNEVAIGLRRRDVS